MTEEEHMQCVKFAIDRVKGRIPVIAGTGSNCTRTAIDMSKEAADYGADGLLLVTPYYNKATQAGPVSYTHLAGAGAGGDYRRNFRAGKDGSGRGMFLCGS